ncbi:MAG: helix-turn-helix transcriptional regulator [Lachnospiraceae bacterium]|nr:helix-turn-helix transcriptional regulator [Lachnospiraceae bacterium]
MSVICAIIDARILQNIMQKELAESPGIVQTEISKLENGTGNPSITT